MRKIIDVGPPDNSGVTIWGWLNQAVYDLRQQGASTPRIDFLQVLADRIREAPELADTTVLIDTADDERLRELAHLIMMHGGVASCLNKVPGRTVLRKALCDWAEMQPPIEEPLLFGAVVRGGDGKRWTRTFAGDFGPAAETWANGRLRTEWGLIEAKEILSPGVPDERSNR